MQAHLLVVAVGAICCALAGLGPPWALPLAGFGYAAIGPVMWWHWARVSREFAELGGA
jgi:hypothetical protein